MGSRRLFVVTTVASVAGALAIYPIATNLASNWLADVLKEHAGLAQLWWTAIAVFAGLSVFLWRRHEAARLRDEFALIVPSERLEPGHLRFEVVAARTEPADAMRRPFVDGTYIPRLAIREEDQVHPDTARLHSETDLRTLLEEGRSILLIGKPTEGKTRTLYEVARGLRGYLVVQPKDPLPSEAAMALLRGRKVLCLLDDLNAAVEKRIDLAEFYQQVQQVATDRALAAACRDGNELAALKLKLTTSPVQKLYEGFTDRFVLRPATAAEKATLARQLGEREDGVYLSLGDVSMRGAFELMRQRFESLGALEQQCLWAIQLLAAGGVAELRRDRIRALLAHQYGLALQPAQLREPLRALRRNGFLLGLPDDDPVVPEAAFVAGSRARRNYRDGLDPAQDLPRLVEALWAERDALALNNVALNHINQDRPDEALALWLAVFDAFASASEGELRGRAAAAGVNAGIVMGRRGRNDEAVARHLEVVRRLETDTEPDVREQVAKALYGAGFALAEMGRHDEALQRYAEVARRFGDDTAPQVREQVAGAMLAEGITLGLLGRSEEELQRYGELARRFEGDRAPVVRSQVAGALFNAGARLRQIGRTDEELQCYVELAQRFEGDTAPDVREQVAKALLNAGLTLGELGRNEEELQHYAEVMRRFDGDASSAVREHVASAMVASGVTLGQLGRQAEELLRYAEVLQRFGEDTTPAVLEQVALAQFNTGAAIALDGRPEEALQHYAEVVRRFGDDTAPGVRGHVAKALLNSAVALGRLGRSEEALARHAELVRRFGHEADPDIAPLVERARAALAAA